MNMYKFQKNLAMLNYEFDCKCKEIKGNSDSKKREKRLQTFS